MTKSGGILYKIILSRTREIYNSMTSGIKSSRGRSNTERIQ